MYWQGMDNTYSQQLDLEAKLQSQAGTTRDFEEGVAAFREKRRRPVHRPISRTVNPAGKAAKKRRRNSTCESALSPSRQAAETGPDVVEHVVAIARQVEAFGFHGLWVTDAFARGKPTLDPLILLGALATQTSRIELGTCVVQVPLRHPVEHAHRVLTLTALAKGRFRFGVGSGSTRHDFDAVQAGLRRALQDC